MGYSHYYNGQQVGERRWKKFTDEVRLLLAHPAITGIVCKESDQPGLPPVIDDKVVCFNGKGEQGHETFVLQRSGGKEFCKTGGISQMNIGDSWGKHYDIAVCAVLLAAKRHLGYRVTSDGNWSDEGWMRARALYARVTSHIVACPWPQKTCIQCERTFSRNGHAWGGHQACQRCGSGSCRVEEGKTTCYQCHSVNSFRYVKPTTWCWYCASGYKGKVDAAADLTKKWEDMVTSLEKVEP